MKVVPSGVWNFIKGLGVAIYEIAEGLISLVIDAGIIAISSKIPDSIEPEFLKKAANTRVETFAGTLEQIIDDPIIVLESVAQSISDTSEKEGIMYVTGGAATSLIPYVGQSKYLKLLKVEKDKANNTKAVNPAISQKVKEIVQNNKVFEGIKKETVELYKDVKNGGTQFVDDVTNFLGRTLFPNQTLQMSTANSVPVNVFSRSTVEDRIDSVVSRSSVKVEEKGTGDGTKGTGEKVNNIKEIDDVNYGEHFTKGKRGRKELAPNVRYVTQDGYKYTTDELGRIVDVEADNLILQEADRNLGMQRAAGREDRLPDDDGGHLIGSQFHGSGDIDNLVAQNSQINRSGGEWYKMETVWANALKEVPPKKVSVRIEPVYNGDSLRPSSFEIFYKVEGKRAVKKIIKNQSGG